jgi:hypothetical protein
VVNSTPRPHFTPGKDLLPIVQEAGWVPGPDGRKISPPPRLFPDRPARSQSLYRLSHPAPPTIVGYRNSRFKAYAPIWVRPSFFWNVTWNMCVVSYGCFGTNCRSHLQESSRHTYLLHRVTCQASEGLIYYSLLTSSYFESGVTKVTKI